MKTIKNLGKVLKKEQQLSINGGSYYRCKDDRECHLKIGDTLVPIHCDRITGQCVVS
ncbi:hypothetical protein [Tenacibaculum sp. M341]|uniref:hypothetical protein n=1 Tax=Tenacibaculum sp. M341 TaxID=2530339 RepID=UPI00140508FC|nr:hypothetical protein [Tenacibaculum sp. M341]